MRATPSVGERLPSIDWVKLDIEGLELKVLQGGGDCLRRIGVLQFEFGGCNIDSRTFLQDSWYLLTKAGFALYRLAPSGPIRVLKYEESLEHFRTTDYVAVRVAG